MGLSPPSLFPSYAMFVSLWARLPHFPCMFHQLPISFWRTGFVCLSPLYPKTFSCLRLTRTGDLSPRALNTLERHPYPGAYSKCPPWVYKPCHSITSSLSLWSMAMRGFSAGKAQLKGTERLCGSACIGSFCPGCELERQWGALGFKHHNFECCQAVYTIWGGWKKGVPWCCPNIPP